MLTNVKDLKTLAYTDYIIASQWSESKVNQGNAY